MSEFQSSLDTLIPPEIKNDEFYQTLELIAREEDIRTVLEIGSSSGSGSTEAFVNGLNNNPNNPHLFCMEISQSRFNALRERYENYSFVNCYHASSVPLESFPTEDEIIKFYQTNQTNLNLYPLEQVLDWWRQDTEYLKKSGVNSRGIQKIKEENNIDVFDVVLIDGSEFTGKAELEEIYGAKFIFLDDINTFKNYENYNKLLSDSKYVLIKQNKQLRNGYAVFGSTSYSFVAEINEQQLVKNLVKPGMKVFDVGANLGDYSLLFSELVGKSGEVYTFEPTSAIFKKLQERIKERNLKNVNLFQKAVFSKNQPIEFNEFSEEYSVWNSIGIPQMQNPLNPQENIPIVKTEIVEAVAIDSFCKEHGIESIDYLKIDVEGAESDVLLGTMQLLQEKAIKFIQFEISQKMLEGLNRKAEDTFKILTQNGYECHRIKSNGQVGEKVLDSHSFYENYIAFPELPIHFFTIVLNGEPFIRYHIDIFKQIPFKWHWHIIEGVADLKHDTGWSLQLGGKITDEIHKKGRSKDGTSEYLDELAVKYPENVTLYRKPEGEFWDGKREMVNAPLANIKEECLLWQVDVDEIWTLEQICNNRKLFIKNPEKTAAFYWCWYFVGENLVISSRNCYAQNPQQDWLRTWRFKPGYIWAAHEPPILVENLPDGEQKNVAALNPFMHAETEKEGLIFQHFAYVTPEQLRFKEQYYGYQNAVSQWQTLQSQSKFPVYLREYFAWVGDNTTVDRAESLGVVPLVQKDVTADNWKFLQPEYLQQPAKLESRSPTIIIDGVFFQLYSTGIARVWRSVLAEWAKSQFASHIIVLDRLNTTPKIPGIRYRTIPAYNYNNTDADKQMLQQVCDEEGADLFISTYYTTPISTASVFMAYDMIPEVVGADFSEPMWREKHHAIRHASSYISISESTARDIVKFFPDITPDEVTVAHCGLAPTFTPATTTEISAFKNKYGISKPYFLLVGAGSNYKNAILFFRAFAELHSKQGFEIVCTGSGVTLANEYRQYASGSVVHSLILSDEELKVAYSGAVALVYPSLYEGFGMPVAEALACGCPVVTCANASIPEVAGEAAIYVDANDVEGLTDALCEVQKPKMRNSLIAAGLEQVKQFSWANMADTMGSALMKATLGRLNLREINLIIFPDWSRSEETVGLELQEVIKSLVTHPDRAKMTLLIDNSNIAAEEADLILSSVAMNLLMEEDLEVDEGPEIVLVGELSQIQRLAVIPQLQGRISLENENKGAIALFKAENIPTIELDRLKEKVDWLDLSSKQVPPKQRSFEKQPFNAINDGVKSEPLTDKIKKILGELETLEKGATGFFKEIGEVESYYERTRKVVSDVCSYILQNQDAAISGQIAKWFTLKAKLFLYFSRANLKDIYKKRAEIMEFALKIEGHQVDYDFPERKSDRHKIRLGIIANNFEPHPETFATLPVYKHLNREEFEIILYYLQASGHRLEKYCRDRADAAIKLPEDLDSQVQTIRNDDLDILFVSSNITSQTNVITLLALHRLARIQIVGMNSPVTTGMRHIDCYISSKLTESETDAAERYTEKLATLDGPDQCFDFATEEELSVTTSISRKQLSIDENAVVYISGANFYKIIPEVEATWVQIIAQVPNSILLLYPFNPNWAPSYPVEAFKERFLATLSKYGVGEERLILLNALPNRADIKECLKLANIYLDAFPFSGMTSLIDPLQVGLPMVAMQGESARSRRGASLLRYLEIPELIANSEEGYIELAVNLGMDSNLRGVYSDRIETKMQANPQFLDSRYYSTQMGALFKKVFQEYLAKK